jgi:hypothetical protein
MSTDRRHALRSPGAGRAVAAAWCSSPATKCAGGTVPSGDMTWPVMPDLYLE